jgi:glucose-6-phosphate dehydrogenase assembly protein OpcA
VAARTLEELTDIGTRAILISYGTSPVPTVRVWDHAVALEGLRPDYLNNAVAALRLSSLPTFVWWRGGDVEMLGGLADLADRLVFDVEDPGPVWARAATLVDRTAVSDLRWTRLTRWRALMAHFFDIAEVRAASVGFDRLVIEGADVHAARLFAGWLASSLRWRPGLPVDIRERPGGATIEAVEFGNAEQGLTLRLGPGGACVETEIRVRNHVSSSRVVSLGDQGLTALLVEELRIRSRDLAFERAAVAAQGVV